MRTGVFFFGGVEMPDRGAGPPAPQARRSKQADFWAVHERLVELGVLAEDLGYDSYWLAEHHFQHEGYEVVPNGILLGAFVAARTSRIKIGTLFNIVPQWHPLRLAEDFAVLHNLSGGRALLGVGRGTVPREIESLSTAGVSVGSFDNPERASADAHNRELFEESMEVIRLALSEDELSFAGRFFTLPPGAVPDRGASVETLTLVPRPRYPFEIWQAVTSPPTIEYVPRVGHGAVFWNLHHSFLRRYWERYEELWLEHQGEPLGRGEKRMLVLNVRVEETHEAAWERARPGHDEFWKFLGPYGWSRGYMGPDGKPSAPGLVPSLEESVAQRAWVIGTPEEVAEGVDFHRQALGLEHLAIFPNFAGDPYEETEQQMARFAGEVLPLLS
ncbi:MAG TPA: LLM class flavin-dependent oxidoreductase [Acidimicrobiales bacterium]|nr:LLM class flavin-dependent oxidoreductase [Acidimicrobiales bacterium]